MTFIKYLRGVLMNHTKNTVATTSQHINSSQKNDFFWEMSAQAALRVEILTTPGGTEKDNRSKTS